MDQYFGDLFSASRFSHLVHSPGLKTEKKALEKVIPSIAPMRAQILKTIEELGYHGLTPDEYAQWNEKLINTVRRRFTDLWKDGLIRHHPEGLTRLNLDRNDCIVWVLGKDPTASEKAETKVRKLRNQLKKLGEKPCC